MQSRRSLKRGGQEREDLRSLSLSSIPAPPAATLPRRPLPHSLRPPAFPPFLPGIGAECLVCTRLWPKHQTSWKARQRQPLLSSFHPLRASVFSSRNGVKDGSLPPSERVGETTLARCQLVPGPHGSQCEGTSDCLSCTWGRGHWGESPALKGRGLRGSEATTGEELPRVPWSCIQIRMWTL